MTRVAAPDQAAARPARSAAPQVGCHLCTSLTAPTVAGMLEEAHEAVAAGATIVELRIDFLKRFEPEADLQQLIAECPLPAIVTYRPSWEGGQYTGSEPLRLAALKFAALLGAPYIDVELKAAPFFFAAGAEVPVTTKIILSSHDYEKTPPTEELEALVKRAMDAGADIVKFATMANDITDAQRVLDVLARAPVPTIALAMGERGLISRLLAPKYGGFLTFGALSPERASAPGQPTLRELVSLYHLPSQSASTKLFGIVGNPVGHSRSPAIHNAAMRRLGYNGVYVPLLVDDVPSFLAAFSDPDWAGFSVTIPHKEAALAGADEVDPVAQQIGAVNTLVRQPGGRLRGNNTDWSAAVAAIERGLDPSYSPSTSATSGDGGGASPLRSKRVVIVGAGGAGRALAFGTAARGAKVTVANRSVVRAEELAAALAAQAPGAGARACSLEALESGAVVGDVLVNTTSVGMHPNEDATPVPAAELGSYQLVFDAVYTPLHTRLLREAAAVGCRVVTGDAMFVGQAADQFRLFTGLEPPVELMTQVLRDSLSR